MSNDTLDLPKAEDERKSNMNGLTEDVMVLNNLKYRLPSTISLVDRRHHVRNYFDISSYPSTQGELICKVNSSTEFVNGGNSYLVFDVVASAAAKFANETGALSLFDRILIESKDGTQLERVENLCEYAQAKLYNECPQDYLSSVGRAAHILSARAAGNLAGDQGGDDLATSRRVVIPMWWLSGLYHPKNKLMPPQLTSGMRVRLTLRAPSKALAYAAGSPTYTINNPLIVHDSHAISPMIQRKIMEQSQNGLDFMYKTAFESTRGFNSTAVNIEINKSVSQACGVYWFYKDDAALSIGAGKSQNGTESYDLTKSQIRLGDEYLPKNPIESGGTADTANEMYYNTVFSNGEANQCVKPPAMSYDDYRNATKPTENYHLSYQHQTLERSAMELSGRPVNNSRSLVINQEFAGAAKARTAYTYLEYVKLAKVFPRNIVAKS